MAAERYMKGTEGNPDYLVIATNNGMSLGVKGITQPGPGGTTNFGIKIRTQLTVPGNVKNGAEFVNTWPLTFNKISTVRASGELIQLLNTSHLQFDKIINAAPAARFGAKAFDFFEQLGITLSATCPQVAYHLEEQWFSGPRKLLHEQEPAFILSTFVSPDALEKHAPKGLTIDQAGVKINGKAAVWPKVITLLPGVFKGTDGDGPTDNVVPIKPKKDTPTEKSSE